MTTHAPAIDVSHDQPLLPNQHFSSWLRGQTTLFISQMVAVLGIVLFLAEEVYYVSHFGNEHSEILKPLTIKLIVDYAHVVFMAVFILVLIQVLDDNERGSYRVKLVYERVFKKRKDREDTYESALEKSKHQLKIFKRRFLWFWIGMLFLYVFFACQHSYQLANSKSESAEQSVHNVDLSFLIMDKIHGVKEERFKANVSYTTTEKAKTSDAIPKPLDNLLEADKQIPFLSFLLSLIPLESRDVFKLLAFPFIVFFFNNLTLLFVFWCFLALYIPSDEMAERYYKYRNGSFLIVGMLTLLFPLLVYIKGSSTADEWRDFIAVFDALSGVINAIVLALLIARLDSKLIGLPSWLISILYSYAAVQPLFMVFELTQSAVLEKISTSVLIFVFVSKIYFFLIIIYALQTGKMLNYLLCFPILSRRAKHSKRESIPLVRESDATQTHHVSDKPESTEGRVVRFLTRWDKHLYERLRKKGQRRILRARGRLSLWLRSDYPQKISKWLGLGAICCFFVYLIVSLLIQNSTSTAVFNVTIDCIQLLFVLVMIVILYLVREENHYGGHRALTTARHIFEENLKLKYPPKEGKKQLKKFKEYFLYFWCATFLLYIVFLFDHLEIGFCLDKTGYIALTSKILGLNPACAIAPQPGSIAFMVKILIYPFLEVLLGMLNLLFVFWCFVVLRSPAFDKRARTRQKLLVNYSSFVVALLIALFPLLLFRIGGPALSEDNMKDYATVFDGMTGTLSAVVLALLIARMDSNLFGLPSWSIGMLFAYASIQPLFVAFALSGTVLERVQTSVLTAALGLKICFFLIIAHSLQSERALSYLACFPFLKERVDSIFENQFEIRLARAEAHSFTISILKKNQLRYSIERRLKSRRGCDKFVRYLRKRMKDRNAYLPPRKGGTQTHDPMRN
ncbi:MAG: hypothetical protein QOH63_2760 [Acidobacteriota bacterium]|jgi:hypothetical protein|nr:hypothetical protein [Acidobacteriota bacterium]